MNRVYVFIIHNDVWILIVAALGLFWYVSDYFRARQQLKRAVFSLERERGTQARNNALTFIFVLSLVMGLVFYVNRQIAPTLPAELLIPPTPTPDILRTPLASPTSLAPTIPTPTPPLVPTITLASQPGSPTTAVPNSNTDNTDIEEGSTTVTNTLPITIPTPAVGCNLQLMISEPRNGAVVSGAIEFFGTVNTSNFGGYRLEANGPQTNGQWASLLGRTFEQPVVDGLLGNVNLNQWEAGPYLIRLTTVDSAQNDAYQCVIQITLEN
ncbi:MAG: hypothetical protein GY796_18795 [Chloroflexi bacterium]|nr:hypothetical protein [Chloroflexota bacterium]